MPTRSQSSLLVLSDTVQVEMADEVRYMAEYVEMSISHRTDHNAPNLAVLVMAVRKVRNVSQMELGTNRRKKDGSMLFADAEAFIPVSNRSGFFSLIANIEQGGRKSEVSSDFLAFVSVITGLPLSIVEAANAEDAALRAAFAASNRK